MDPEETSPGNVLMIGLQQRTNGIKGNATEGRWTATSSSNTTWSGSEI